MPVNIDLDLAPPKTGNEDLERWLEENMRRIQKFLLTTVQAAYGGMRYRNDTPPPATIGTTPVQITLFDTEMPRFGVPLYINFDETTDEVVIDADQGGVYSASLFINFEGEQGQYQIFLYLDDGSGSGPQPVGDAIIVDIANVTGTVEFQLSTIGRINGDSRWSVWAKADKANAKFNIIGTSLYFERSSQRMLDVVGASRIFFPPWN